MLRGTYRTYVIHLNFGSRNLNALRNDYYFLFLHIFKRFGLKHDKYAFVQLKGKNDPKTFEDAHQDCKSSGGHLAEIKDNAYTSAYLSERIDREGNQNKFWIGGLRNYIAGKKFDVWYDSADMLNFNGFPTDDLSSNGNMIQTGDEDISFGITMDGSSRNKL